FDAALLDEIVEHDLGAVVLQLRAAARERAGQVVDHADLDLLFLGDRGGRHAQHRRGGKCTADNAHNATLHAHLPVMAFFVVFVARITGASPPNVKPGPCNYRRPLPGVMISNIRELGGSSVPKNCARTAGSPAMLKSPEATAAGTSSLRRMMASSVARVVVTVAAAWSAVSPMRWVMVQCFSVTAIRSPRSVKCQLTVKALPAAFAGSTRMAIASNNRSVPSPASMSALIVGRAGSPKTPWRSSMAP